MSEFDRLFLTFDNTLMMTTHHIHTLKKYKRSLFLIATAIIVFVLYRPVLDGQFLFDDISSIVENKAIRSLDLGDIASFSPLRFIGYLSFALNFHFAKLNPFSYYIVNICIHLLFIAIYFLFLQELWKTPSGRSAGFSENEKEALSMAAALIFALHPMSSFAVSYIVQRLASLTALFYISCLYFYLKIRLSNPLREALSYIAPFIAFLVCAVFTKQNSFTLFPTFILIEMFCFTLTKTKIAVLVSGVGVLFFIFYLMAAFCVIDLNEIRALTYETKSIGRIEYFINQFPVLCFYLIQLFLPTRLALDYPSPLPSQYADPAIFIPGMALAFIISTSIALGYNKNFKLAGFGILFYFITISIESGMVPIRDFTYIHRTYLPNAGIIFSILILVYRGIKQVGAPRYAPVSFLSLTLAFFMVLTWKTNVMFQDPLKVWQNVIAVSPTHARGYASVGMAYLSLGRYEEAETNLLKALTMGEMELQPLNNLGIIYAKQKQYDKALDLFDNIIQNKPDYVQAYINLANIYSEMGDNTLAIETYRKGYRYNPNNFELLLNLGQQLAFAGIENKTQLHEALELLDMAQKINDKHPVVYYSKGIAFLNLKEYNQAKYNFSQALFLDPDFIEARLEMETIQ